MEVETEVDQYRDFRSRRRALNRDAKQSSKYYGYRGVQPGWVGQTYYDFSVPSGYTILWSSTDPLVTRPENVSVSVWTKRDMWEDRETDIWPLDRRHHVGKRKREKYSRKWDELRVGRRMKQKSRRLESAQADVQDAQAERQRHAHCHLASLYGGDEPPEDFYAAGDWDEEGDKDEIDQTQPGEGPADCNNHCDRGDSSVVGGGDDLPQQSGHSVFDVVVDSDIAWINVGHEDCHYDDTPPLEDDVDAFEFITERDFDVRSTSSTEDGHSEG